MRPVTFACLVLVLGTPLRAQTPDPALIERAAEALHSAGQANRLFATYLNGVPPVDTTAIADSVRAAFRRDFRPDLLREALATLERPEMQRLMRRVRERAPEPRDLVGMAYGFDRPKKGSIADSALAARYAESVGTEAFITETFGEIIRLVVERSPRAREELATSGMTPEQATAQAVQSLGGQQGTLARLSARVALAGVPVGEAEAAIAFSESPAGRYVRETTDRGVRAAAIEQLVAAVLAQIEETPDSPPPPPPAPPAGKP